MKKEVCNELTSLKEGANMVKVGMEEVEFLIRSIKITITRLTGLV
jgi:hypothetical protein